MRFNIGLEIDDEVLMGMGIESIQLQKGKFEILTPEAHVKLEPDGMLSVRQRIGAEKAIELSPASPSDSLAIGLADAVPVCAGRRRSRINPGLFSSKRTRLRKSQKALHLVAIDTVSGRFRPQNTRQKTSEVSTERYFLELNSPG